MIKGWFISIVFLCSFGALAQEPAHYFLSSDNIFPTNEIYGIQQDHQNQLWFGSDIGIFSFDGIKTKQYANQQQNGRSVSFLKIDESSRIWGKNFLGQIYNIQHDSLNIVLNLKTSNPSFPQFDLSKENHLIYIDNQFLHQIDDRGKIILKKKLTFLSEKEEIIHLIKVKKELIGLTSNFNVFRLNENFKLIEQHQINHSDNENIQSNSKFIIDKNQIYLYLESYSTSKNRNLYSIQKKIEKIKEFDFLPQDERIHGVYVKNNQFWVYGSNGVIKLNSKLNFQERWFNDAQISDMLIDQEGLIWLTSLNKGVIVVPHQALKTYLPNLEEEIIKTHYVDHNHLIFGSYAGNLVEFDRTSLTTKPIFENKEEAFLAVKKIKKYGNYTIISRGRLCIYDHVKQQQIFPKLSNFRDFELVGDSLFMVHPEFIFSIHLNDLLNENIKYRILKKEGGKSVVYDIKKNALYFNLADGVYRYANDKWSPLTFKGNPIFASSIFHDGEILWIGTISNGALGFKNNELIYHFSTANFLSESNILKIVGGENYTWILTDKYLYRWNKLRKTFSKFGDNLGVPINEIIGLDLGENCVFLTTKNKVFYFPSAIHLTSKKRPQLFIQSIEENGNKLPLLSTINLPYNNKQISIKLSTFLYQNRGDFSYEYQLKGLSNQWIKINASTPEISFPTLSSGDYELCIRVNNPYGKNSFISKIKLNIAIPIWKSTWFVLLCFVLSISIIVVIFRKREHFIRKKALEKNRLIASQLTALKSQMNPHFLFNTLNSLQDLILMKDFQKTNFYLNKYSQLIRKILEISDKNQISIGEEIEVLEHYLDLEKLRFGDDFKFEIIADNKLKNEQIYFPPMLIQPFIENALKHGILHKKGEKLLTVSFELNEKLIITIIDNGVGRKKSAEINSRNTHKPTSFATQATDKRIHLVNLSNAEKIEWEIIDLENDGESLGTKVIIRIPVDL